MITSRYSSTIIFLGILSLIFTILLTKGSSNAESNRCPCKYHSAVAQGPGTCSRSEDRARCTIEFSATNPEEYKEFVNKLHEMDLNADPRESIHFANKVPPEEWDVSFVRDRLPVLFAISQRFGFEGKIPITKKILENKAPEILKALQEPSKKECVKIQSEGFRLNIGYGCIEIHKDEFSSMVKTPWSDANFYCDFTNPAWLE